MTGFKRTDGLGVHPAKPLKKVCAGILLLGLAPTIIHAESQLPAFRPLVLPGVGPIGSIAFVQASTINLRAQPKATAAILGKAVANTRVKVVGMSDNWCEVELLPKKFAPQTQNSSAQPSTTLHGFVACTLLTAQELTLEMAETEISRLQGQDELEKAEMYKRYNESGGASGFEDGKSVTHKLLLDWTARAFWISPSLTRWALVGNVMERAVLSYEERSKQFEEQKPKRFAVPEFEAMKKKLAEGILVAPSKHNRTPAGSIAQSEAFAPSLKSARERIQLPTITPSFFRGTAPVMVSSERYGGLSRDSAGTLALADALSASNNAPFRAVVTGEASYALNPEESIFANADTTWHFAAVSGAMDVILGIWDVGGLQITFDRDATLHGITKQGNATALNIHGLDLSIGYDSPCSYSSSQVNVNSTPVAGYAPTAWLSWAGKSMPDGEKGKARIKTRQFKGATPYDLVVSSEIDLDRDGIADLLVWNGRYQAQVSAEGIWQAIFGNVDGQWQLLRYEEDADCT